MNPCSRWDKSGLFCFTCHQFAFISLNDILFKICLILQLILFYGYLCFVCMSVYHLCPWCPWNPEDGVQLPRIGVTDGCELLGGCWETNPGPLKEQPLFLTAESSLQPPNVFKRQKTVD